MQLSREQILASTDLRKELVDIPEWGGSVYVRVMTAAERDKLDARYIQRKGQNGQRSFENFRAEMVVTTVVDDAGQRLFTDADVPQISLKSAAAVERIFNVASRLNGLSAKDQEELAKN